MHKAKGIDFSCEHAIYFLWGCSMNNRIRWGRLALSVAVPLAVGAAAAFLTGRSMQLYDSFENPPLSPPGWIFPVVWTLLYILMGIASYQVSVSDARSVRKQRAMSFYAVQLGLNFFWPLIFFRLQMFFAAFLWIIALVLLVMICTLLFAHIRKSAGALLLPYLLWVIFASYLNLGVYLLN